VVRTDVRRWLIAAVVAIAIIALLAWARNSPGVGGRQPDPPGAAVVHTTTDLADAGASA
jgi:hypothetical protein